MEKYIIIGLAAVVLIMLIVIICLSVKNKNLKFGGIKVKNGVRYTKDEMIEKNNEVNVTYNEKDIVLEVGKEYVVGENKMLPGTYTVLATNDTNFKFNLRVGGLVREYEHGEKIVLSKGDTITAVSHSVILR
ncbi:MAG: hypothetical protein E7354_03285 [Clostridiales bacterium]|nr:hypothetical protein [Clostridiales bacterium]